MLAPELGAHDADTAQLEVIGYVEPVVRVVPPFPAFNAYDAVDE